MHKLALKSASQRVGNVNINKLFICKHENGISGQMCSHSCARWLRAICFDMDFNPLRLHNASAFANFVNIGTKVGERMI